MTLDLNALRGIGNGEPPPPQPPPPQPPPPHWWPPMWTEPRTIVIRERAESPQPVASPCEWYEDLKANDVCQAPAVWLIVSGGVAALLIAGLFLRR